MNSFKLYESWKTNADGKILCDLFSCDQEQNKLTIKNAIVLSITYKAKTAVITLKTQDAVLECDQVQKVQNMIDFRPGIYTISIFGNDFEDYSGKYIRLEIESDDKKVISFDFTAGKIVASSEILKKIVFQYCAERRY